MVGSSKILTVSYGTFSCTLEGFDDSFSTMKAIAEYFRDLASDDRYFGAEPPTPDADMLARIAEREISRRVEARTSDNGIVLRAASALAAPATSAPKDVVQEVIADASDAPDTVADAPAMPPAATPPEKVANLQRPADIATAPTDATDDTDDGEGDALTFDDMMPEQAQTPVHADADSVAAKLQRIRAVVGKAPAAPIAASVVESPVDVQDTFEADVAEPDEQHLADTADDVTADELEDQSDAPKTEEDVAPLDFAQDWMTPDVAENKAEEEATNDAAQDDVLSNISAQLAAKTEKPIVHAHIVSLRDNTVVSASIDDTTSTDFADENLIANVLGADEHEADDSHVDDIETNDFVETDLEVESDATVETAIEADDKVIDDVSEDIVESYSIAALDGADDLIGSDPQIDHAESDLSPEDEADLQDELAQVESEMAVTPVAPTRHGRDILPKTDDAAMSRIMSQTDEALSEPEGSRRRNAIAQLKAAVAATEAARQLGDKSTEKAKTETAFREDLDQAVRPSQRPARPSRPVVTEENRTARPRPAPLKLVASQRVDAPVTSPSDVPVQPRRVAMATDAMAQTDASSFAEFAEEMGATELNDLLEAAAAYTAFVEGVEDFSRPQIMKKVQLTTDQAFSREDGLRSFGTLLRQGRISKVRNGRFQVSEQTRFRPEQRAG